MNKKTKKNKQFQPLTEEQNPSKKWEIKRYKDLMSSYRLVLKKIQKIQAKS